MIEKLSQWWETLSTSLLTGADGLGVYLDSTVLSLAHVQKNLGGFRILHFTRLPYEQNQIKALAPDLKEVITAWGVDSYPVSLAVSPNLGFFRRAALPRAASENLAQVVSYELDRFLPLPGEKLYYDFQVLKETDEEIHLMLMALPRDRVEECLALLTEATLKPIALQPAPLAAGNAFAMLADRAATSWLLLHLEHDAFELSWIQGQRLRNFKRSRGIKARELSQEILSQIEHASEQGEVPKAVGIYGEGGPGSKLGFLQKYELDTMYPSHLALSGLNPEADQGEAVPAVGAALSCLTKPRLSANLLPPAERAAVKLGKFSLTSIFFMVFLGLSLIWVGSLMIHKRVMLFQVNRQIAQLKPEAQKVERLLQESQSRAKQMESLRKIGDSPDKLRILRDLTRLIPDNTWLFHLRLHKQELNISGMSRSASELIPLLEKSGWLKNTEFVSPIVTDDRKLEHFKIKAEIKGLEPAS